MLISFTNVRNWRTSVSMAAKTERLNIRLTQARDTVLRRSAEALGESASEYKSKGGYPACPETVSSMYRTCVKEVPMLICQAST